MTPIGIKDFLVILPAISLGAGGLCVLLFQVILPKYRAAAGYWISLLFLSVTLIAIMAGMGWLDDIVSASSLHYLTDPLFEFGVPMTKSKVLAFQGHVSWNYSSGLYSFAVVLFILLIVLMGGSILRRLDLNLVEAYQMMLFSGSGLLLLIYSENLIMLFISLELSSLPIFVLAGWDRKLKSCNEAGIKYFLLSAFSAAFLLLGIAFVYGACGSADLGVIHQIFQGEKPPHINMNFLTAGLSLMLVGLCFKVGLFPLHGWVADVYEGSLTIVTAFMASLVKIASVAVIFKVLQAFSGFVSWGGGQIASSLYTALFLLAAGSMLYGNIAALTQKNLKRLFAYSSIAHGGYMAALFPLALNPEYSSEAARALWFYVFGYAAASTLAFGVIAFLETSGKESKIIELDSLKTLSERSPYAAFLLSLASLSFAGIPPLLGFYGKFYILKSLLGAKMYTLAIFLSVNSLIAVFYYARIFLYSYWFQKDSQEEAKGEKAVSKISFGGLSSWASITLIGAVTLVLGVVSVSFMK